MELDDGCLEVLTDKTGCGAGQHDGAGGAGVGSGIGLGDAETEFAAEALEEVQKAGDSAVDGLVGDLVPPGTG